MYLRRLNSVVVTSKCLAIYCNAIDYRGKC